MQSASSGSTFWLLEEPFLLNTQLGKCHMQVVCVCAGTCNYSQSFLSPGQQQDENPGPRAKRESATSASAAKNCFFPARSNFRSPSRPYHHQKSLCSTSHRCPSYRALSLAIAITVCRQHPLAHVVCAPSSCSPNRSQQQQPRLTTQSSFHTIQMNMAAATTACL